MDSKSEALSTGSHPTSAVCPEKHVSRKPCARGADCLFLQNQTSFGKAIREVLTLQSGGVYSYILCDSEGGYSLGDSCWLTHFSKSIMDANMRSENAIQKEKLVDDSDYGSELGDDDSSSDFDSYYPITKNTKSQIPHPETYKIPLTGESRSNVELVAWIMVTKPKGLSVVQSTIPPHLIKFFSCCDGTEYINYVWIWKKKEKKLKALGISQSVNQQDYHPHTKCREGCLWTESEKWIGFYTKEQLEGRYYYALNNSGGTGIGFCLDPFYRESPCVLFDHLKNRQCPTPTKRADPYMLAYVKIYQPSYIYIVQSVHPDFFRIVEDDGNESIDHVKIHAEIERVELAKRIAETKTNTYGLLGDAQSLTDVLIAGNTGIVDEHVIARLDQLRQLKQLLTCITQNFSIL
jgi:hypothetical protein